MFNESELLRTPSNALACDPRTQYLVKVREDGQSSRLLLDDQYQVISRFTLSLKVPEDIRISFETAKNLYLYSWFVYRFYPIAEQNALTTLELALRIKFPDYVEDYSRTHKNRKPGLKILLQHAANEKQIRNESFPNRTVWATELARERLSLKAIESMQRLGLTEFEYDDSKVSPTDEDLSYDWLSLFIEHIPKIRNNYAHGSIDLNHSVLRTFDISCSMIEQLFT